MQAFFSKNARGKPTLQASPRASVCFALAIRPSCCREHRLSVYRNCRPSVRAESIVVYFKAGEREKLY